MVLDIIACSPAGKFTAIEMKRPGVRPSPEQREFIENVQRHNGVALIAYSLDDVLAMLKEAA
jgi:hypothetical protein